MENINALRLIKALIEISPTSELMNEQDRKEVMEFINTQIDIEMDVNDFEIPGFEGTMDALNDLSIFK